MNMKVLLGKKREMTQIFREDGTVVAVTLVEAGPCVVTALRENSAGQKTAKIGFGNAKHVNKAQQGEWKDLGKFELVREFPVGDAQLEVGSKILATNFEPGQKVNVIGTSKGKGFQGVVKRHGFSGSPATHGHKDQLRMPGSIGAGGVQRVFKGLRMAGRMGTDQVTVKNLEIVKVDAENNLLAIKGAVPGSRGSYLVIAATEGNVWQK
jgi:large subunit ribosomal protein L3